MNKRLKRLISVLMTLAFCVCIILLSSGDSYAAKDQFSINVEGVISQNQEYYEVEIEITNNGKDFTGFAELEVMSNYYYSYVGYDTAISIPSGSTKTYTVKVPASVTKASNEPEVVVIYDSNKKIQYTEKFKGTFSGASGILNMGILSDNADELSFFDLGGGSIDMNGQKYKISIEELSAGDFVDELDGLDYLVINDYDTSVLSEEQMKAIGDYVARGGCLILGTGERGEEVLSGFDYPDSFLGAKFDSTYETPLYLNGSYEDSLITSLKLDSGTDYSYTGMVESYSRNYGVGSIEIIGFDLSLLDDLDDYGNPPEDVLQTSYNYSSNSSYYDDPLDIYSLENIQGYMEKPANMGSVALVLLIIVYVALIGPIIYLILKKMNKRERMWIVIPGISLIFVLFVFLISFGVKVRGLTVKSVTVEQLGSGKMDSIIFGYTPKPETWSVDTKDEYEYGTAITNYDYNTQEASLPKAQLLSSSDSYHLMYNSSSAFETGAFVMTSTTSLKDQFEIDMDLAGTKGTVVNNTGLSFDYVLVQNYTSGYQLFENVSDGETMKVDFNSVGTNYSYSGATTLLYNEARAEYQNGNYDDASLLAAIAMGTDYIDPDTLFVIGVKASDSLTTEDEKAWHCYYTLD